MVYGDLQIFDIVLFAGIAIFLIFRLRSVLGKRTGFEGKKQQATQKPITEATEHPPKSIPELKENFSKLKVAYKHINNFDHVKFLEGAKMAFETIINAFNKGDKKTLKTLLTTSVYKSFETAIDSKKTEPDYQFYSLNIENIESVEVEKENIKICIKFVSEQFKNNDETTVIKKEDVWTFEKLTNSNNPSWLLSST